MNKRRIKVDYVARVEGEAALDLTIASDGSVKDVVVDVFEPPRFFESFLIGRRYDEVAEITGRICGICPHPHMIAATQAVERAMGIEPSEQTKALRKLVGLGDWIQSHALHVYCLAIPDFVGLESVLAMAGEEQYLPIVKKALELKRLGNDVSVVLCGREIHPVTIAINGFTHLPDKSDLKKLQERMKQCKDFAYEGLQLAAKLPIPDLIRRCEHVALRSSEGYAVNVGNLVSTEGLDVSDATYPEWIIEKHVPPSNAKHAIIKGRDSFLVGPLARVNLNFDRLSADAQAAAKDVGFQAPDFNPYKSIIARQLEIIHALDESIALIDGLDPKPEDRSFEVKAGEGYAVTEAPRGICCHGYRFDKDGICEKADVVAPTSRNVYNMEHDFRDFVPKLTQLSDEELALKCEMLIRSYDPCFSCSVHAIKVKINRE